MKVHDNIGKFSAVTVVWKLYIEECEGQSSLQTIQPQRN